MRKAVTSRGKLSASKYRLNTQCRQRRIRRQSNIAQIKRDINNIRRKLR